MELPVGESELIASSAAGQPALILEAVEVVPPDGKQALSITGTDLQGRLPAKGLVDTYCVGGRRQRLRSRQLGVR